MRGLSPIFIRVPTGLTGRATSPLRSTEILCASSGSADWSGPLALVTVDTNVDRGTEWLAWWLIPPGKPFRAVRLRFRVLLATPAWVRTIESREMRLQSWLIGHAGSPGCLLAGSSRRLPVKPYKPLIAAVGGGQRPHAGFGMGRRTGTTLEERIQQPSVSSSGWWRPAHVDGLQGRPSEFAS